MFKNVLTIIVAAVAVSAPYAGMKAEEFCRIPSSWKWTGKEEIIFSYDGTYEDSSAFVFNAATGKRISGVSAPEKFTDFPLKPDGAVNLTYSPDSTMLAFTRENDLYVADIATGAERRITYDGTDLILNGYASWVYYEEILGRSSRYRAFWWSPDSRKIGFYRFDNTMVPLFPIYSPFGQDGELRNTRYPKAGETNPRVSIGIADVGSAFEKEKAGIVWADFDSGEDQYFGIPFWGPDSKEFFIARMPRLQNTLDLYSVDVTDGSKKHIYRETSETWLDWINQVVFTDKGLYMARRFETGWEQIYFLSYDGNDFRRLTEGKNWAVSIKRVDEKKSLVYFTAKRDGAEREVLYAAGSDRSVKPLTDPSYYVQNVSFSPDGKYFAASYSNLREPVRVAVFRTDGKGIGRVKHEKENPMKGFVVADQKGPDFSADKYALGQLVYITTDDGFRLPGIMVLPVGFDPSSRYPVHVDLYGGPDAPMVRDRWTMPSESNQWWSDNGIIEMIVDCRASGHNGRAGLDMIYRQLSVHEVQDFIAWADYLKSLPYVIPEKIGVEGFSFGGTMTSLLLMTAPDSYHYGIAGGGVYDWALYDSHYTERYMDTPQNNPEGYAKSRVLEYVDGYPVEYGRTEDGGKSDDCYVEPVMLKLTHGTGDDNVHFQNTLQLIDRMHRGCKKFEFMIYPDGMHGYGGYQGEHFREANREFWLRYLKN